MLVLVKESLRRTAGATAKVRITKKADLDCCEQWP
jgi:hypothetical protein